MTKTVTKPWGREIILTEPNLPYVVKIIEIKPGQRLSLQYHNQKIETLVLFSGNAIITIDKNTNQMTPLQPYTIKPPTPHRIQATTDCQILEASSPEAGKTLRLEDDYHRGDETLPIQNTTNAN